MATKPPIVPLGSPPASEGEFKVQTVKPDARFLSKAVQPPSNVYVGTNDVLVVGCATNQKFEVVTVSYRLLRVDGYVIMGQFVLNPPQNRAVVVHTEPLTEGFLLSVSCKAKIATSRGQTFARAFITDPVLGAGQPSYMLMADYVTTAMAPAHPNGRNLAPSEGPGFVYAVSPTTPAAGAEWTLTVPANARWKMRTGLATFNASGVAANRNPGLLATVGVANVFIGAGQANIPASASIFVGYHDVDNAPISTTFSAWCPLPETLLLQGGYVIQSFTPGLDAGDQYGLISFLVEEWLDNV